MSAQLLAPIADKPVSEPLGNTNKLCTDSDSHSADLLAGMRWLQNSVKLPSVLRNCLHYPIPQQDIHLTEWHEKDFRDRTKIHEKTSVSFTGLCTCGGNAHCLVHSHIKSSLNQSRLSQAIRNAPKNNRTFFGTLTIAHSKDDRLDELIAVQVKAFMEMTRRVSWKKAFVGVKPISRDGELSWTYRHLECTFSLNFGYHPHVHFVVSADTDSNVDFIRDRVTQLWKENISAMVIDGTNRKGQIKVRRMTGEELQDHGRSRYRASSKVGVDIVEVARGSADEERLVDYATKGLVFEASADFSMKTSKSTTSFSIPQLVLHAAGIRPNARLIRWENEQCWSDYHVASSLEHWKRCLARFYKSMLGKQIYRGCKGFDHYSELGKENDDESRMADNEKVKRRKGWEMIIPPSVAKKMGRGRAIAKFDFLKSDPDFQKAIDLVKRMVTSQDFSLIKITTPEERESLPPFQILTENTAGVEDIDAVKVWNGLQKVNDGDYRWARVDDWEKGLKSIGVNIRGDDGIPEIKAYKENSKYFKFEEINKIPMLRCLVKINPLDVIFPLKQVEDDFTPPPAGGTNHLKRAA